MSFKDARRTNLLNAASELIARKPTVTLAEVADHAKLGRATLHRYFPGRDDLLLAVGYRAMEVVAQAIYNSQPERGTSIEAFTRIIEALAPMGDKLYFLLNESLYDTHPDFVQACRTVYEPLLVLTKRGQAAGELRPDLPTEWLLHYITYGMFATWQSVYDGNLARNDAARLLTTTLLGGVVQPR